MIRFRSSKEHLEHHQSVIEMAILEGPSETASVVKGFLTKVATLMLLFVYQPKRLLRYKTSPKLCCGIAILDCEVDAWIWLELRLLEVPM
ncbi:unnamed protein product [Pieris macdunnoughi]|uniref:Uncharacterized protein n=1 Tax=Pieris macdunnoughi TaxID=345717 RepID=A0A821WSC2_9NEOP|nr:unnamed protein product [Pieris macdunnoughi]